MPFWPNYRPGIKFSGWVLAVVFVLGLSAAVMHDFHSSITEVEYNTSTGKYEVSIRVFTDDLEATLNASQKAGKLLVDKSPAADKHIAAYMTKAFALMDKAQKPRPATFVGKELDGDVTWVYFEIEGIPNPQELIIYNAVLMDTFDDQKNIVNCKIKGAKKSFLFDKKHQKYSFL
jgi:hypothetical protein